MSAIAAGRMPAWRSLAAPALATLVAFSILIGLGVWQLERKAWKEAILAQIESRAHGAPAEVAPEPQWPAWRGADDEFRRVRLEGRFQAEKTVAVHGLAELRRGQATQGFYLFTPLARPDGSIVIVNRGIVPTERLAETLADLRLRPATDETVIGLVRASQARAPFVPENRPERGEWYVRSVEDIAKAERLERVAPFFVDQEASGDRAAWPRGGQTQLALRNDHLQYAFTWFGLAVALLGVFSVYARRRVGGTPGGA